MRMLSLSFLCVLTTTLTAAAQVQNSPLGQISVDGASSGDVQMPPAEIYLDGAISTNGAGEWVLNITGTRDGESLNYRGVLDNSNPSQPVWGPALPLISGDPKQDYKTIEAFGDTPVFRALAAPEFLWGCPDCWVDGIDLHLELVVGSQTAASVGANGDEGFDSIPFEMTIKNMLSPKDLYFQDKSGNKLDEVDRITQLARYYGLSLKDIDDILNLKLSVVEIESRFVDGAKRKLVAAGLSEAQSEEIRQLAEAHRGDAGAFRVLAEGRLLDAGLSEEVVDELLQDASRSAPLRVLQDPAAAGDDVIVTISSEFEVEVSIPPFATIKVKTTVTVSGPPSKVAEMVDQTRQIADKLANDLANSIRKRMEQLRTKIKGGIKGAKDWWTGTKSSLWSYLLD